MKKSRNLIFFLLAGMLFGSQAKSDLLDEEDGPLNIPGAEPGGHKSQEPARPAPSDTKAKPSGLDSTSKSVSTPAKARTSGPKSRIKSENKANEPVHFESKGLKGLREKGLVELVDDVVVTQAQFRLEADKAQVFFDEAAHDVVRVVAEGNVKIFNIDEKTGEKLKAYGNQVVFLNKDRRVIMEGNARLWRGEESVIRGKKITYEMDTGWIRADRVAGELAPSEKDKK
jgi:lipopolysaccharide transport protein LptA